MNCAIIVQITQFYAIELRRNYAIYADITQIIRSHYANKLRNIRRNYADITQALGRHYANTIRKIYKDYANITQCFYAIITQHHAKNYAKITQIVYAQHHDAIITQISLRRHYANIFCLRNNITKILLRLRNYAK